MKKITNMLSRFNIASFFIICISFLVAYVYVFDVKLDLNGDNANYYMLGKALSQGEGYVNISSISKAPNNHFPPGYPALIAVIISIFPDSAITLKIANGIFFLGSLLIIFSLFQHLTENKWLALLVVGLVIFNGHFLRYSTIIMTEIPFLFFSSLSFLLFIKTNSGKPQLKDPWYYATIVAIGISYYIRSLGVSILGGVILYLLFQKEWKLIPGYILGFGVLFVPWFIRGQNLGGNSYIRQLVNINPYQPELGNIGLAEALDRISNNLLRYISREVPDAIFPGEKMDYYIDATLGEWALGILIVSVAFYGIVHLPKYKWLIIGYLGSTLAILMVWPDVWIGVRFILPSVPFLLLPICFGAHKLLETWLGKLGLDRKIALVLLSFLILPMLNSISTPKFYARENYEARWENYFRVGVWLKANADASDVVACRKPTIFYLFSGTSTTNYKYTDNAEELMQDFRDRKVKYVVLDQLGYSSSKRYLYPVIRDNPERFKTIVELTNPNTFLLEFIP